MAEIHNQHGTYLTRKSAELGIAVADAAAFLKVESGGRGFGRDGRMIIRFENHVFYNHWGENHAEQFRQHFQFNSRRRWTGHKFRASASGEFAAFHGNQSREWAVLEFARTLDDEQAIQSISMGAAQVLGTNYRLLGYDSAREMFDDMSGSIDRQLDGLFSYIANRRRGIIVNALREHNYRLAARYYNGRGKEELYGNRIQAASQAYQRITSRPATSE